MFSEDTEALYLQRRPPSEEIYTQRSVTLVEMDTNSLMKPALLISLNVLMSL